MAYVVLARKWRPRTFDQVVGQQHVCRTLKRALELGRWSHAYLFSGPRGVGKTTVARIFAKALNCDQGPGPAPCNTCPSCRDIAASRGMDVLEIDGASHRGIDEIRTLRENARYAPTKGKHKVYIIDEVHMLTSEAFNALLKTLEEPPPNVVFVFATTEPHKVPATIASRCQRFEFRKIAATEIRGRLQRIAEDEEFRVSDEALGLIARRADGSMRDAEGLLDQVVAFTGGSVEPQHLEELLGETGEQSARSLLQSILARDARGVLTLIDELLQAGTDPGQLAQGFGDYLRDLVLVKVGAETDSLKTTPGEERQRLGDTASTVAEEDLVAMLTLWAPLQRQLRTSPNPRLSLELTALSLAKRESAATVKQVLERLRQAEELMVGREPSEPAGLESEPSSAESLPAAVEEPAPVEPGSGEVREARVEEMEAPLAEEVVQPESPPEAPETSTDAGPSGSVAQWEDVIEELNGENHQLGAFLVGTQLQQEAPGRYRIFFPELHEWHLDKLQIAEHKSAVVRALERHVGGEIELLCSLKPGLFVDEPDEVPVEPVEEIADPAVKKVIDVFDGDLLGYEKTEEARSDES